MKCDCCGKKKKWLESFEDIEIDGGAIHICVKCSTLLYKIRYAIQNNEDTTDFCDQIEKKVKSGSDSFIKWYNQFVEREKSKCNRI